MNAPLELWGGAECTLNRVHDRTYDQLALTGHGDRLDDLDRFAAMGLKTLRMALLWERIETSQGVYDWTWADASMARLQTLGVRPIVGLVHHGAGPVWTHLTDRGFAQGLADHATRVVERYPWVTDWTPVNEPLTTARFSCLYGLWHPHQTDETAFWSALLTQIEATTLAMRAIRRVVPDARLIQTEDHGRTYATAPCGDQALFENHRRLMTWDLLCGRVDGGHPLYAHLAGYGMANRLAALSDAPTPPDVIGLNHYVTSDRFLDHRLDRYPARLHGGNGRIAYADTEAVRALADWAPGWRRDLVALHARYSLPVAVTECHLGCDPAQQAAWLEECWSDALAAREAGVHVEAVTVWALAGSTGWDRLLMRDGGAYEPGVLDASRPGAPETPLAETVRRLASGRPSALPRSLTGWWRRPDRLLPPLPTASDIPKPSSRDLARKIPMTSQIPNPPVAASDDRVVPLPRPTPDSTPIVCFSHLRWDFVFQRPQHLMTRFAATRQVYYVEEPILSDSEAGPSLDVRACSQSGVTIVTPRTPDALVGDDLTQTLEDLIDDFLTQAGVPDPVLWYYTPMMLPMSRRLPAAAVVYDCMDELANFRFAPPGLRPLEQELIANADLMFTGGYSLFEAKQRLHPDIHPFPSSVDRAHFAQARAIPAGVGERPRLGFYGVIDERMDLELIAALADARPDWTIVMVGPVVKISEADLPRRPNIEYVGARDYDVLPAALATWDVALMPFAINASTQFISPTKTPEYLAGGRPVVSTPIRDVERHYGDLSAVWIAGTTDAFVAACDAALEMARGASSDWLVEVDTALAELSWDQTLLRMSAQLDRVQARRAGAASAAPAKRSRPATARYDVLVVGAGFAGAVMAERLAADGGKRVLVVDRRSHIGGNAWDHPDAAGVMIHEYGPHIFHTNSVDVFAYLSRFTRWRPYEHRVLAQVGDVLVPMPINRTTLNALYGLDLQSDEAAAAFLASRAEPVEVVRTSEDVVVSAIGRELYETFFQGYTRKQWGLDPSQLDKSVTSRVPTRTDTDDRYFTDAFQAMPLDGYTAMFERMLDHPNIEVRTGVEFRDVMAETDYDHLVYTGPIDEYFGFCFGRLPYRSLKFRHETLDQPWAQAVATVNFPDEATPYTRITEYKHLTGQRHGSTSRTYEYPAAEGDPYYPIPRAENQALFKRYEALAAVEPNVSFVGRLATYRYYNMDQVVGQALATYRKLPGIAESRPEALQASAGV